MCEMLIRVVDKVNTDDVYLDCGCLKRDHVIDIMPDGHKWGEAETNNPERTIVKLPGVPVEKMQSFLAPEPGDPIQDRMLQRRAFTFDVAAHKASGGKALVEAAALALRKPVSKRADPNVLGDHKDVLGGR